MTQMVSNPPLALSSQSLNEATKAAKLGQMPPVDLWTPDFCGDLDMRITRDGTWFYQGSPIGREAMVKLFSSILKKEEDRYYLVTPVEKVGIQVEDLPLHVIDLTVIGDGPGQELRFTCKTGESVTAGPKNPITMSAIQGNELAPQILVRRNLSARVDRKTFFRMVDLGCHEHHQHESWFGLWSQGQFFPLIPSSDLA